MKNLIKLLSITFILLYAQFSFGQTQIYILDFESAGGYTTTPAEFTDGAEDYFTRTDESNISTSTSWGGTLGSFYFGAQDIDADQSTTPCVIDINNIDITGYNNIEFRVYLAEDDATDGAEDWDASHYVHFDYDIDNSNTFTNLLHIESEGGTNTLPKIDDNFDGTGEGTTITNTFTQFTRSISGTGTDLDLKITINLTQGDVDIAIDHIEIYGYLAITNDTDSEAYDSGSQPATANIASTSTAFTNVFQIEIEDVGAIGDDLPTSVTNIRVKPHTTNNADWTDHINAVKLNNGADITLGTVDITDTYIDIAIPSGSLDIANGTSDIITLQVQIKNTGITDNAILSFMVDADDHGFTADQTSGSTFTNTFTLGDFNSEDFIIDVTATKLLFFQQPENTKINNCMTSDVSVEATDQSGNRDLDFISDIRITSTGTLSNTPIDVTAIAGLATFSGANCISHSAIGTNLTLNAERTTETDWDVTSNPFDIYESCISDLMISEYVEGSSDNKFIEIYNGTGIAVDLTNYDLVQYNNGSPTVSFTLGLGTSTIAAGGTFVIENSNESIGVAADLSTNSNVMGFNGNDVIALRNNGTSIDIIGKIGEDPGTEWGTNPNTTAEHTLIRKSSVTSRDTDGSDAFDPATEWDSYAQNYIDDLGSHTVNCICEEPTTNSNTFIFSNIDENSMDISWTAGDGTNRIVVAKLDSPVDWSPTDGITYSANSNFTLAPDMGSGNKIIYKAGGNSVSLTGLQGGSTYYFKVFEFNCNSGNEDYLIDEFVLTGSQTTNISNVQNLTTSCITETTAVLNWDAPSGSYEGILVTIREGATPVAPSCDGATLTTPNTDFSTAGASNEYCGNGLNSYYVYNDTGNTVTITGLTNASTYTFKVFTYNGTAWSSGTLTTKTIDLLDVENENAGRGNGEVQVSWSNPTNCYDEIMIVGKDNTTFGAITAVPSGLTAYTANSIFGTGGSGANLPANEFCVFKSTTGESNVNVTGLTNGNNYCFKIFVRKGTEWSDGVTVCQIPLDISIIEPGDLMIVAVNTNYPAIGEEFTFVCFQDIKVGTPIDFTENGWEREYPNKWGTTEGAIRLTRTSGGDLPAGTTVTVIMNGTNGKVDADFDIYVAGADELAAGNWSITELNTTNGSGFNLNPADDIWIMQNGSWVENTTASSPTFHDDDYTGNVLYGWTATGWGVGTGTELSDLYPYCDCFNTDVSGLANNSKVKYTGLMTTATKLEWISRVNNELNWTGYPDDASYDAATPQYRQSGATFPITAGGYVDGVWTGSQNTDWFDCGNWQSLTVPNEDVNVNIGTDATQNCIVDDASTEAANYGSIAKCKDLTISNQELHITGDNADKIEVHGNLLINSGGKLYMNDGTNGELYLYGNWDNQATEADFIQGQATVFLKGSSAQTISTNSFTESFYNLTVDNSSTSEISLNNNIKIEGIFNHKNGDINLNGSDIEIAGIYSRTSGTFVGNTNSNFLISNSGSISDLMFINNTNLNNFTINRTNENATILSDLNVNNNLTITDGSVTLSAGKFYTVGNTLTNTPNTPEALTLKSSSLGTASLLQQTGAVPATCERYLSANSWHYFFTPLSNSDISILTTTSWAADNPNFFWYDEQIADYWQGTTLYNPTGWTAPEHTGKLLTNKSYIHLSTESRTYSLSGGNLDDANHSFTLSYTNSGTGTEPVTGTDWDEFEGWNLIGNPYTAALNWDDVWTNLDATEKTYLENGIYYYDPTQSKYVYYGAATINDLGITVNGGSQMIPANQGFFVKTTSAGNGNNIVIDKSARAHSSQAFWKGEKNIIPNLIKLNIEQNGYTDETIIRTNENATDMHDKDLDAYKMFSWDASKPQIYTTSNQKSNNFSLNTIAEITGHKTIPISIYTGIAGEYSINQTENTFESTHVWLEDKLNNSFTNFNNPATYEFSQGAENNEDRFVLHFELNHAPSTQIELMNRTILVDTDFNFELPNNTFYDVDEFDQLTISTLDLPEWLTFENGQLSGYAKNVGQYPVNFVATDIFGEQVQNGFIINVIEKTTDILDLENNISIYPNPTTGIITVKSANQINGKITIANITGQIVTEKNINTNNINLDLSEFAKGIYIINVKSDNQIYREKIILK